MYAVEICIVGLVYSSMSGCLFRLNERERERERLDLGMDFDILFPYLSPATDTHVYLCMHRPLLIDFQEIPICGGGVGWVVEEEEEGWIQ